VRHLSYLAAAQEYEDRTPPEAPTVVSLGGGATLRHLAAVMDDHGIADLYVRIRGGRYVVTAETTWQSEECEARDLATAIQDAICAVVESRRRDDAAEGR